MKKDDLCYGLKDTEDLSADDPSEVIEQLLDEAVLKVGESFDETADRFDWPIKVYEYRRMDVGGESCASTIAERVIDDTLCWLDEQYGNPDGPESNLATQAMKDAALAFGRAMVAEYVPWTCEPTGEVIEYTREQAKALIEPDQPAERGEEVE